MKKLCQDGQRDFENIKQKLRESEIKKNNNIRDKYYDNEIRRIAFRPFGSIFIVTICDELENELAILDFINVIMKIFDEVFKNVCELHLIMNPDKLYLIIDEMISGGIVIETNKDEIISNYLSKC